ncbi:MAG: biopolymer transporter ExbD [Pirellulales bacterium]|nr:biopolymer transporter ExbD [Pirellulales bacterium]
MTVQIKKGRALAGLSLTPLIDVVFLLLIFFLVATEFAEEQRQRYALEEREMDIQLPEASEARPLVAPPTELFINIDQQGRYYVNHKFVSVEELQQILKTAWVERPGRQSVVIRADRRCVWEPIVAAMNACNKAGIHDYTCTTRGG